MCDPAHPMPDRGGRMLKVLIAEDETGILNSLANAFSWDQMGCEIIGLASNGIQALETCISNPPDIVISDIVMPGIDGIALLKYVKEKNPTAAFIILSGHRNFEYAKDSLNLGANSFLPKPVNFNELKKVLERVVSERLEKEADQEREIAKETLLRQMLSGHMYMARQNLTPQDILLNSIKDYRVCVLSFDDNEEADMFRMQRLARYLEEVLNGHGISGVMQNELHYVLIVKNCQNIDLTELQTLISQIQKNVYERFHTSISAGVSSIHETHQELHDAYMESLKALAQKFFTGNGSLHYYLTGNPEELPQSTTHSLFSCLSRMEYIARQFEGAALTQQADQLFYEWAGNLGHQVALVKSSFIILSTMAISRFTGKDDSKALLLYEKNGSFQKVIQSDTLESIHVMFLDLMLDLSEFCQARSKNRQTLVSTIYSYIQDNYKEALTLGAVAKAVYLSPSYLSALLSQETGKNFPDIVNETRITAAIELLKDPSRRIADVSHEVGFNEPQYFSIIFKKYTGLTPRDYRNMYLAHREL